MAGHHGTKFSGVGESPTVWFQDPTYYKTSMTALIWGGGGGGGGVGGNFNNRNAASSKINVGGFIWQMEAASINHTSFLFFPVRTCALKITA